ncbi:MAG: hypothetical protein LC797_18080 [Chloroflexi bacterium]|nr:hypothetical protein [Chloroflexota bacterium]
MFRYRFLRSAAVALGLYGVLGLFIASAMLVVGTVTFGQVSSLQATLESERVALVQSVRTVSATLHDTAGATSDFQRSIESARAGADQASALANDSAGTFRDLGTNLAGLNIFGFQPFAGLSPQFARSADQLQQLAISLGVTREALAQNRADVQRVGADLNLLQTQLDAVAASLSQPGVLGLDAQSMLPFQFAFYGMCLLVILQSAFSIVAGIMLYRVQRALGTEALFPALGQRALAQPTAETEAKHLSLVP